MLLKNIEKYQIKDIDVTPEILVSQASASTVKVIIKDEGDNTKPNLTARPARTHNTDALAIKLNRLCAKLAQYKSHKDFSSRYIQEKLVTKGLELSLEKQLEIMTKSFLTAGIPISKILHLF